MSIRRQQVSFQVPDNEYPDHPQFKVLINGQQFGVAVEHPDGWSLFGLTPSAKGPTGIRTLSALVDAVIEFEAQLYDYQSRKPT